MKLLDVGLPREARFLEPALRLFDHPLRRVDACHSRTLLSEHLQKGSGTAADFQDSRVRTNQFGSDFVSNLLKLAEGEDIHPAVEPPRGLLENLHQHKSHLKSFVWF